MLGMHRFVTAKVCENFLSSVLFVFRVSRAILGLADEHVLGNIVDGFFFGLELEAPKNRPRFFDRRGMKGLLRRVCLC